MIKQLLTIAFFALAVLFMFSSCASTKDVSSKVTNKIELPPNVGSNKYAKVRN